MFTQTEIAEFRADAESRFGWANGNGGSDAVVKRNDLANPQIVDGLKVPKWDTVHALLEGRIAGSRGGAAASRTVRVGDTEVQVAVREWHCAATTTDLRDGDVIAITAGENAGLFLQLVEAEWQDQATARRLPVVQIQKPKGWTP